MTSSVKVSLAFAFLILTFTASLPSAVNSYPANNNNYIVPKPAEGELLLAAPVAPVQAKGKCKYFDSYGECVQITPEVVAGLTGTG